MLDFEMSQWELRDVKSVSQDHTAHRYVTVQRVFPLVGDSGGHAAATWLRTCLFVGRRGPWVRNSSVLQQDRAARSSDLLRFLFCVVASVAESSDYRSHLGRPVTLELARDCRPPSRQLNES